MIVHTSSLLGPDLIRLTSAPIQDDRKSYPDRPCPIQADTRERASVSGSGISLRVDVGSLRETIKHK